MGPSRGTGTCTAARMSAAATTFDEAVFLFVAFGMPSERSEGVLNS